MKQLYACPNTFAGTNNIESGVVYDCPDPTVATNNHECAIERTSTGAEIGFGALVQQTGLFAVQKVMRKCMRKCGITMRNTGDQKIIFNSKE